MAEWARMVASLELVIIALVLTSPLVLRNSPTRRRVFGFLPVFVMVLLIAGSVIGRLIGAQGSPFPSPLDWMAWGVCVVGSLWALRDRETCLPVASLYLLGLAGIGMELISRGFLPARFYIWAGLCEITGFLLVAGVIGWVSSVLPIAWQWTRIPERRAAICEARFGAAQAVLFVLAVALTVWIATDLSFDGMGTDDAILGLAGRRAGCPAALMLLGTAIVMAWQSRGWRRAAWQYASLFSGLIFTTSIGWTATVAMDSRIEILFQHRSKTLLITASMMTLMTWLGLQRIFPTRTDWTSRARRVAPVFAGLATAALVTFVISETLN